MLLPPAAALLCALGAVPLPPDWASGVASSNLLFAPEPAPSNLLPSIENGFIGGDVGCSGGAGGSSGTLHIAGLYSGGSHIDSRASLPNPLAAEPVALDYRGAALDVSQGVYLERWALAGCGPSATLESRRYAHRQHRSLLVWQLRAINATKKCNISLSGCHGGGGGVNTLHPGVYQVNDPEEPADPSFKRRQGAIVAIAHDAPAAPVGGDHPPAPNWAVTLGPKSPTAQFLAVVRTTLEPDITPSNAMREATSELAKHQVTGAATLDASHAASWAEVYGTTTTHASGGGIELVGNSEFAAQVNSSLYYLLCSVRSDWPYGISEGGIASDAYRGMMFWSDGVMDGPLFVAINAPIAGALLEYRAERLEAAKAIAKMNGYRGAYWPWQSAVTGFERSCGNSSIAMKIPQQRVRVGCYWMHEIHISADVALYFRQNYYRTGRNVTFLKQQAWPIVSATADFFVSRANRTTASSSPPPSSSSSSTNFTFLNVIGPDVSQYVFNFRLFSHLSAVLSTFALFRSMPISQTPTPTPMQRQDR